VIIHDRNGETREIEADFGPIVRATKQLQYRLGVEIKLAPFKTWCRANLQPGWYVAQRPDFMGGGHILFLEDDQDYDIVVIGWGPEKK
jgi:hypothetical protein